METKRERLGQFPNLIDGDRIEIWYCKPFFMRAAYLGGVRDDIKGTEVFQPQAPHRTHNFLGTIDGVLLSADTPETDVLDAIFSVMQAEPEHKTWCQGISIAESNGFVMKMGVTHSSMSVGDMVRFYHKDDPTRFNTYVCARSGWQKF